MTTARVYPPIEELVMQRAPMLLVDHVIEGGEGWLAVAVDPRHSTGFAEEGGQVPAWVGLEYMAQAVNAYAGWVGKKSGAAAKLGFLLGTRRYHSTVAAFAPDTLLEVVVHQRMLDENNLALFHCEIKRGGDVLASAEVKAIQPENPADIFKEL